jgi:hypothetical protein
MPVFKISLSTVCRDKPRLVWIKLKFVLNDGSCFITQNQRMDEAWPTAPWKGWIYFMSATKVARRDSPHLSPAM